MMQGNIIPHTLRSQGSWESLREASRAPNIEEAPPSPAGAEPKRSPAADAAIAFLKLLDAEGWHNLVRIDPAPDGQTRGQTFAPGSWDAIASFVDQWNGSQNLYYSVNEPRPHSPDKKLSKDSIKAVRFLFVDKDPDKTIPFAEARAELEAILPRARQDSLRPTLMVDSGGGFQFLWRLAEKLDAATFETAVEEQGRGLAKAFDSDAVQNIDRILRLPGTTNLPTAEKRARGQVVATARLVDEQDVTFTLSQLADKAPPQPSPEKAADKDETVAAAMGEIDMAAARGVIDYTDLPDELREKFERALAGNRQLAGIWKGDETCLFGDDRTRSGWRASLAIAMARCDVAFSAQDYAELVHAWPEQADALDRIDKRDLARDWGRLAAPIIEERRALIARHFQEVVPALTWIDPCGWEGQTPRPREWEVEGWIPRGEVTLLYGDGGIGKTLLAHQYATAAATGRNWLGQVTRPARVMCFFCEDSADELHRRQVDINASLGVSTTELRSLRLVSRKFEDNLLASWDAKASKLKLTSLWYELKADAVAFDADVLIVDTLADVFGGSEIDRVQVNAFVKTCLGGLATAIGGSVLALGHPSAAGKSSGTGTSGSTAWNNAARSRIYLKYPEGKDSGDFRELEGMKLNYGPKGRRLKLRWNRGAFDMVAGSAPAMLRDGGAMAVPTLDDAVEAAVVSALIDCAGEKMSTAPNSHYFTPKVLQRRVPDVLAAYTKQEVLAALERLESRRVIRMEEVGRNDHRKPINGYVVVPDKLSSSAATDGGIFK